MPTSTRIKEMVFLYQALRHDIQEDGNLNFCLLIEDTYVDYMKSDLFSADEEPLQSVDVSSGFSFGNSSEGAWLLGDSKVSYPCFCMEYEQLISICLDSEVGLLILDAVDLDIFRSQTGH